MSDSDLKEELIAKSKIRKPQKLQLGEKVFVNTGQHGYHLARIVVGSEVTTDSKGKKMYLVQWDSTRGKQYVAEDTIDWITRGNDMLDKVKAQTAISKTKPEQRRLNRGAKEDTKLNKRPTRSNNSGPTEDDKKRQLRSKTGQQHSISSDRIWSSHHDSFSDFEDDDGSEICDNDTVMDRKGRVDHDNEGVFIPKQALNQAMTSGQCTDSAADVPSDTEIMHQGASKRSRYYQTKESSNVQFINLDSYGHLNKAGRKSTRDAHSLTFQSDKIMSKASTKVQKMESTTNLNLSIRDGRRDSTIPRKRSQISTSASLSINAAAKQNIPIQGKIGVDIKTLMSIISEAEKHQETQQQNFNGRIERTDLVRAEKVSTLDLPAVVHERIVQIATKEPAPTKKRNFSIVSGYTVSTKSLSLDDSNDVFAAPMAMQNNEKNKSIYYYCGYSSFYGKYQQLASLYQYGCYTWLSDGSKEVDCDILYLRRNEIEEGLAVQRFVQLNQSQIPKEYTCTGRL
jgi:hypothetical protein